MLEAATSKMARLSSASTSSSPVSTCCSEWDAMLSAASGNTDLCQTSSIGKRICRLLRGKAKIR